MAQRQKRGQRRCYPRGRQGRCSPVWTCQGWRPNSSCPARSATGQPRSVTRRICPARCLPVLPHKDAEISLPPEPSESEPLRGTKQEEDVAKNAVGGIIGDGHPANTRSVYEAQHTPLPLRLHVRRHGKRPASSPGTHAASRNRGGTAGSTTRTTGPAADHLARGHTCPYAHQPYRIFR